MIAKVLAVAALLLAPSSLASSEKELFTNTPAVMQVFCALGSGTAFVAEGHILSVAHVTEGAGPCGIDAMPVTGHQDGHLDFVTIDGDATGGFKINCDGYSEGQTYFAIGYAEGLPKQRVIALMGTGQRADNGEAILYGDPTVIPGMSGGPIINVKGEVVGTVNMYSTVEPLSLSVPLSDTKLCMGRGW